MLCYDLALQELIKTGACHINNVMSPYSDRGVNFNLPVKIINSYLHKLLTTDIFPQKLDGLQWTSVQNKNFQNMLFAIINNCMCCVFIANINPLSRNESNCLGIEYIYLILFH